MTSPLRRAEATLSDVPRPLRPMVWLLAAVVTPFWLLADLVRTIAQPVRRMLAAILRAARAVVHAVTWPLRVCWRALLTLTGFLTRLIGGLTAPLRALWRALGVVLRLVGRLLHALTAPLRALARAVAAALSWLLWLGSRLVQGVLAPLRLLTAAFLRFVTATARALRALGRLLRRPVEVLLNILQVGLDWLAGAGRAVVAAIRQAFEAVRGLIARLGPPLLRLARSVGRAVRATVQALQLLGRAVGRAAERLARPFVRAAVWTWRRVLLPFGRRVGRAGRAVGRRVRGIGRTGWRGTQAAGGRLATRLAPLVRAARSVRHSLTAVRETVRALRRR